MVEPKSIVKGFAVSPQLTRDDFSMLADAGYKTIINNRPDGEEAGQLSAAEAQQLATENGLNYVHIPVRIPDLSPELVDQFDTALKENPGPVLAHCKTGTRSCILWSLANARNSTMTVDELMQCAAEGGYDLTRMRPLVEQYMKAE